jgi:hypothetical protein
VWEVDICWVNDVDGPRRRDLLSDLPRICVPGYVDEGMCLMSGTMATGAEEMTETVDGLMWVTVMMVSFLVMSYVIFVTRRRSDVTTLDEEDSILLHR